MYQNKVKRMLDEGRMPIGMYAYTDSEMMFEALCKSGLDYVIIETEHGPLSPLMHRPLATMCKNAVARDVTPFVRVPANDLLHIGRALDAGALGVVVPHVGSGADAERAVDAAFMPPRGHRGCGPRAAANEYVDPFEPFVGTTNDEIMVIPLIEDHEGIEHCEEIAAVEGVSALRVGILDLAVSMGLGSDTNHPDVQAARRHVFDVCRARRMPIDVFNYPAEVLALARSEGLPIMRTVGADLGVFFDACRARVEAGRT